MRKRCKDCKKIILEEADERRLYCDNDCRNNARKNRRMPKLNLYNREQGKKRRFICLQHYGGKVPRCKCCKEKIVQFLAIDHINGEGNRHRREVLRRGEIYYWLIKNNFPKGFQILCHNCNMAKGLYGKCPHNKRSKQKAH